MRKLERRRSRIEVMADILRLGEAGNTETVYTLNLSYHDLKKYLNLLLKFDLVDNVTIGGKSVTYTSTEKGLRLLRNIHSILGMLDGKEATTLWHGHDGTKTVV